MSDVTGNIRIGSSGNLVVNVQRALIDRGFDPGQVDGHFGEKTEKAVRTFQDASGLKTNGEVDTKTWEMLRGVLPGKAPENNFRLCIEDAKTE